MNTYATVVLAAGKGTRMRSTLPKVLHPLVGVPLLAHVLNAIEAISSTLALASFPETIRSYRPIVVLEHEAALVETIFGERCLYAIQEEQLGTGHALLAAHSAVDKLEPQPQIVLVCYGDTPLVRSEMLARVLVEHLTQQATVTFLTTYAHLPSDYGRVIRNADGRVQAIVEVKRATEEQQRIDEVNSGVYCFNRGWLWTALQSLPRNPSGEYYLTDLVGIAAAQGCAIATVTGTLDEAIGINDRVQLAAAAQLMRRRVLEQLMYAGVTIIDPDTTYIDAGVSIGPDTVILPGSMITGKTRIGSSCRIGPDTTIDHSTLGDGCIIRNSVLEEATLEDDVSYLGDATVGEHVNVGAGTITCNYDGKRKNHTDIGDGAFIGSDTMLVAPVKVGAYAQTGAGSVVIKDVPSGALVVGVPARVLPTPQAAGDGSAKDGSEKE